MNENNSSPKLEKVLSDHIIHVNVENSTVLVSEHTLRRHIQNHKNAVIAQYKWLTPFSIVITLVTVLLTTEFIDTKVLSKATIEALFLLCTFLSIGWLSWELAKIGKYRKYATEENLMDEIKKIEKGRTRQPSDN